LGARQSGLPAFRVADPVRDLRLLPAVLEDVRARRARGERIESDLFPAAGAPASPVIETADA
ncbi:MAG TPA: hypothetical protein VG777_00180, partial [Thermoanaerobaculia bacterium]|nr:hypothetical protein [Thermoanaerobaculia bacterium]